MSITSASHLTDQELTRELARLVGCERDATVALIVHLAEFDHRRLYEPAGCSSLFKYAVDVLRLAEGAAYNRIEAARAARRYPMILDLLRTGALSVTTAQMLGRHLTAENCRSLLDEAKGQTKQGVEELLARRFPRPDVTARVRPLPNRPVPPVAADAGGPGEAPVAEGEPASRSGRLAGPPTVPLAPLPLSPLPVVRPIAPERYEVRFTMTAETRQKLRDAQDLLAHAMPGGDIAQVFDRALTLLVADLRRKKFAETSRPRPAPAKRSPDVRAAVERAVVARDGARCAFVSREGRRCGERRWLEFHHVLPRAAGGLATIENIQLRCRPHNGYEVDRFFGPGKRYKNERWDGALDGDDGGRTRSGTSPGVRRPAPGP